VRILLSNDDGIDAAGLQPLEAALSSLGEVWTVAPAHEQSASSHALTMHHPLRIRRLGERRYSVSGTPADCVYVAIHDLLPGPVGLVVSGINRGGNLGCDVLYSGTVAAAMEGCLMGLPALAVSLTRRGGDDTWRWDTAAGVALQCARDLVERGLPPEVMLNLNVPSLAPDALRGIVACRLGRRRYHPRVDERVDPRRRRYCWIGGDHDRFEPIPGSDGPAIEEGYATLTPMQPELTAFGLLDALASWPGISRPIPSPTTDPGSP